MRSSLSQPSELEFIEAFFRVDMKAMISRWVVTIGNEEVVRCNASTRNVSFFDSLGIPGQPSMSCNY